MNVETDIALHQGKWPSPYSVPTFCPKCRKQNTWQRDSEHDVLTESGEILHICYRCKECGRTTLRRNNDNTN